MDLQEIRGEIDKIDNAMKPLFIKRMECAKHVAETKAATGGDVFAPEREREVIGRRSLDIHGEIREEYVTFLKHLMSICRKYEYGLLDQMQEQVMADVLEASGIRADVEHDRVEIAFACDYEESDLNLFLNMAKLNGIGVLKMQMETKDGRQQVMMTLRGNINDENMRCLLCQLGKEAEDFKILSLC